MLAVEPTDPFLSRVCVCSCIQQYSKGYAYHEHKAKSYKVVDGHENHIKEKEIAHLIKPLSHTTLHELSSLCSLGGSRTTSAAL